MRAFVNLLVFLAFCAFASLANAAELRLAVTTSFNNSGLSDELLPEIKKDLDIDVRLLIVGTGQALKLGRAGDVDAILVHAKKAEEAFIADGFGKHRREIMYNDFVLVGPRADPAEITSANSAGDALQRILAAKAPFVSRGDDSGTHNREVSLWKGIGRDVGSLDSSWYRSAGAGMGASLNTASGMNAYILADRASWLKFGNKGDLKLLYSGDPELFNQYAFLPVNPLRHTHVKFELVTQLESWLVSDKAQKMIASYTINGETLFTPNAKAE